MLFTAEHEEPRRSLQKFIASEINPHVDEWEAAGRFPAHELFKKLGSLGFLGLTKTVEFGGAPAHRAKRGVTALQKALQFAQARDLRRCAH